MILIISRQIQTAQKFDLNPSLYDGILVSRGGAAR